MTTHDCVPAPPVATQTELEATIAVRRAELIAKLVQLKTDTSTKADDVRFRLKGNLTQLGRIIKEGVVDGWANLNPSAKFKLDSWLTDSKQS